MTKAEIKKKFIELIKKYGLTVSFFGSQEIETFQFFSEGYISLLAGSTIDKISWDGVAVLFFYNENTNDYDSIDAFKKKDLEQFYLELSKCLENEAIKNNLREIKNDAERIKSQVISMIENILAKHNTKFANFSTNCNDCPILFDGINSDVTYTLDAIYYVNDEICFEGSNLDNIDTFSETSLSIEVLIDIAFCLIEYEEDIFEN